MKLLMFSVFDEKAASFLPPFFLPSEAVAKRTFGECASDATHAFGKHPQDYSMFLLGSFDDSSASVQLEASPVCVCTGVEMRAQALRVAEQLALTLQRQAGSKS